MTLYLINQVIRFHGAILRSAQGQVYF